MESDNNCLSLALQFWSALASYVSFLIDDLPKACLIIYLAFEHQECTWVKSTDSSICKTRSKYFSYYCIFLESGSYLLERSSFLMFLFALLMMESRIRAQNLTAAIECSKYALPPGGTQQIITTLASRLALLLSKTYGLSNNIRLQSSSAGFLLPVACFINPADNELNDLVANCLTVVSLAIISLATLCSLPASSTKLSLLISWKPFC